MKIDWIKFIIRISVLFLCFGSLMNAQCTDTIIVNAGWNFLSLPLRVTDGKKNNLFPSAVSDAFVYDGEYISKDTLENGEGFWVKFDSYEVIIIEGKPIYVDTIYVHAGWNAFGTTSFPVVVHGIETIPRSLTVLTDFYKYDGGYQPCTFLLPGYTYWVKVDIDGLLILHAGGRTCPGIPTVEYSEKIYNTVKICNQCWLKENLDIGTMVSGNSKQTANGTIEKYCYGDNPANCIIYGGLYQWDEAMQYKTVEGTQGICPVGWHIPTLGEFQILNTAVSRDGNSLKEVGQGTGDGAGTNTTGFSALLSGYLWGYGTFKDLSTYGFFWSSTEYVRPGDLTYAWMMYLRDYSDYISVSMYAGTDYGFSVRCLKDYSNTEQ